MVVRDQSQRNSSVWQNGQKCPEEGEYFKPATAILWLEVTDQLLRVKPHSSVDNVLVLRTGGYWFDPRLSQYSFWGLMTVIATGFIPLSLLSIFMTMSMWESSQWLEEYCAEYWLKELYGYVRWPLWYNWNTIENDVKHHAINHLLRRCICN